jgi:cytochrome c5
MRIPTASFPAITLFAMLAVFGGPAAAQRADRPGKDVVDAVCAACHVSGKEGAPRIGDAGAWATRVQQGLTGLTAHAITGIRKMPAHGGAAGVSDVELQRAIVYMVNRSGANWIEPADANAPMVARTSEAVVRSQCAQCHQPGTQGAPKIGDRAAWTPRLAKGLDVLVASAVHGHGPMPARGGMPDLTQEDIRGAIVYMFNYGLPPASPPPAAAAPDPHHQLVSGLDVYLGLKDAEALRAAQSQPGAARFDIPAGRGYYHVTLALADNRSHAAVTDAEVTMKVSDGMTVDTRTLTPLAANNAVSYGSFFKFSSGSAYNITTEIKRPGVPGSVTAKFEYKAP